MHSIKDAAYLIFGWHVFISFFKANIMYYLLPERFLIPYSEKEEKST